MARAKRTDRAEARRAYRAYLQARDEAATTEEAPPLDDKPAAGRWHLPSASKALPSQPETGSTRSRPGAPQPTPTGRLSIVQAARAAYRTPHYFDDIKHVGPLIFRSHAIWPVVVLCLASALYAMAQLHKPEDIKNDFLLSIMFQFVLAPVPMLPAMMAGFFAPRSSWLAGGIASAISILVLLGVVLVKSAQIEGTKGFSGLNGGAATAAGLNWLGQGVPFGMLMAALAAWYKRFLPLTSPPRSASSRSSRRPAPPRGRPAKRG